MSISVTSPIILVNGFHTKACIEIGKKEGPQAAMFDENSAKIKIRTHIFDCSTIAVSYFYMRIHRKPLITDHYKNTFNIQTPQGSFW